MRVTRPVGERMVAAVDGDPADHLALEAHRPRDRQRHPQRAAPGEGPVGEQPVEPDGHSQPGDHVKPGREQDICQAQAVTPRQPHGRRQPSERHDD
jgi:hypothetical protein